jgi:hypothetical protein
MQLGNHCFEPTSYSRDQTNGVEGKEMKEEEQKEETDNIQKGQ